ncbi:uncharacterized protein AC631_02437 [Debaryomyces fabryi]|uniref:DNA-(apurinic or apyrimidinic site) endonuclease 2 n=1 Tax=Debaryomyces fabryi TaxID=58627 RepID=A0A0V1Q0M9_9ASCO|nr:uncharacterized protein AC631_02437 [Debaryomyces fabryi]KSA01829.1 hypothetical protein AC631_02437 [Debaryomyces fabryi]CUM46755.1 unnamed protein product [Debaryomyces fabryi]
MEGKVEKVQRNEPLNKIENKNSSNTIRYISFNVNGAKTLFNYHPWNQFQQNYDLFFSLLQGDVISLQELKLSPNNISSVNIGNLSKFKSYISLPKTKKGYSGVGLFVRIPEPEEPELLRHNLTVIKAEEGLTGFLNSADYPQLRYRELDKELLIGGYPEDIEETKALKLDSEGRCVCIELACNVVVFSLYCPANSVGSEEGESYRLEFLKILLDRCYYLKHAMGKDVIIIGDINVSLDLIDHADTINEKVKQRLVKPVRNGEGNNGMEFEEINHQECLDFKASTPARKLLNSYTISTLDPSPVNRSELQFLYDTTRYAQGRRMGMYTVWNTLTGARQSNYGSRIDLILTSSDILLKSISKANIWPYIMGSDHCPTFTDFDITDSKPLEIETPIKLKFEARLFYKLVKHRDISQMFSVSQSKNKRLETDSDSSSKKRKLEYVTRKTTPTPKNQQTSIGNFFFKENMTSSNLENDPASQSETKPVDKPIKESTNMKPTSIISISNLIHGEAPKCYHGDMCKLKTSLLNTKTRGKKFWCCPRNTFADAGNDNGSKIGEHQCSFFKWVK